MRFVLVTVSWALAALGCTIDPDPVREDARRTPFVDGGFACLYAEAEACVGDVHYFCVPDGEFLMQQTEDCSASDEVCVEGRWCITCRPGTRRCDGDTPQECNADGTAWVSETTCDIGMGEACIESRCRNLCEEAVANRSYVGCEFYAADLDNAAIAAGRDASSQQYAIVVSNPGTVATEVVIEVDRGSFGGADVVDELESVIIAPGDLEVFRLPRREVDGSSGFNPCAADDECALPDTCSCAGGLSPGDMGARDCRCRVGSGADGMNDGTHSALTARGYRVRSRLPVIAYQFNPLDNVGVFSNDASLLLPTSALGDRYTVVGWPQTIAHSSLPAEDFDSSRTDEDLRAFLTIVGTAPSTTVTVRLGGNVRAVHGLPGTAPDLVASDVVELALGPFDVINLETHGFNADFTGSVVTSTEPVAVFSGSEASDAPRFDDLANRRCCADHLEEQLFPDNVLGADFYIGRTPPRSPALNRAFLTPDSVGEFEESEWVRVVAVSPGITVITTTLPPPFDSFELSEGEDGILEATQNFRLLADNRVAVLQVIPSQEATGIPNDYPGGDPAIIAVPPVSQWRTEYVFLTPDLYAFDFLTMVARRDTAILVDGEPLDPANCTVSAADGIFRMPGDPPPDFVVYGCQLSFPDVIGPPPVRVEDGLQDDGYHTVQATAPISIVVSGWDSFVSYAYAGGLNLDPVE
jgi:hypothetical protein